MKIASMIAVAVLSTGGLSRPTPAADVTGQGPRIVSPDKIMLRRPGTHPNPEQSVPVDIVPGNKIGCGAVTKSNTHALTGYTGVHGVFCVEATTGEVIAILLRKNGTVFCTGNGYVDPSNVTCANMNLCGSSGYYCVF